MDKLIAILAGALTLSAPAVAQNPFTAIEQGRKFPPGHCAVDPKDHWVLTYAVASKDKALISAVRTLILKKCADPSGFAGSKNDRIPGEIDVILDLATKKIYVGRIDSVTDLPTE